MPNPRRSRRSEGLQNGERKTLQELLSRVDQSTSKLLTDQAIQGNRLCNHGYFPKEIARFLVGQLREEDIPCEIGYDQDLMKTNEEIALRLKEKFRDSSPYYFVAFPMQFRLKVSEILSQGSYPLPNNEEQDRESAVLMEKAGKSKSNIPTWKITSIAMVVIAMLIGIMFFFWVTSIVTE